MGPPSPDRPLLLPGESHLTAPQARGFSGIDTWVFDLDNTLYPHDARVWPQVDERITLYVMNLFGLDGISARALQKYFYHRYGTTLRALMAEWKIDPTSSSTSPTTSTIRASRSIRVSAWRSRDCRAAS